MHRGADAGFLLDSPTRLKIDLSGLWTYKVTDGPEGVVKVPSAYDFTGEVTFQRLVELSASDLDKYQFHLVMLGANYNTSATINGDFITNHIGGYTSFTAPIPSNILQIGKENVIRVSTDNQLSATKTIPLRSQVWGWRNYGGILRDIYILGTPKVYIADVVASSELSNDLTMARMKVTAAIDGIVPSATDTMRTNYQLYVELYDKQTTALIATSQVVPVTRQGKQWDSARVDLNIPGPRLWSPETPDLYYLKTYLVSTATSAKLDEYHINTGIRKIELLNGKILLNGKRLLLKGLIWMEDHPLFGSALTHEEMEKDVALIRSVGANAIRFSHHPPHPYMLNLCDRYGLIALEELPIKDVPASILSEEYYIELASTALREMITRDRNHPSVFAWGLGDEFESWLPASRSYVEPLVKLAKNLDSRLVYFATRHQASDACSDLVDITAVTLTTRNVKDFKREVEDLRAASASKPVIIAKMGSEVQPNNHNGYSDPLSCEAQARYMLQHIDAVKSSNIDGLFIWSFNDWRGDRPALTVNSGNPWMHRLGIVTDAREKRLAYEAVRAAFNGDKFAALPIGSNPSSAPIIYVLSGLVILIGTAYLYNANRRFREGLNRSMVNAYNFFADVRDQRIVTIPHSTILGLIVSAATAIVTSSFLYYFRRSLLLDNLLSYVLISDTVKEIVVRLILDPKQFLFVFTLVFFMILLLVSVVLWIVAPVFKARMYLFHAYAITMWSTPPLLLLVPLGMILFRLLDSSFYVLPSMSLVFVLFIWVLFRFLKGISIILDVHPSKVYTVGLVSIAGVLACLYFYLDHTQSASVYMTFWYNDLLSRGH